MSVARALDEALDSCTGSGSVDAREGDVSAEVDVVEVDRLGVRIRGITVRRGADHDPEAVARDWPRRLRDLPERLVPVEVDPELGGTTLRSDPDEMRDDTFTEVEVRGAEARVRRFRAPRGQAREPVEWTTTRDGLGRLVEDLAGDEPGS